MNAGTFQFYPLHATLMNFTETARQRHIMTGDIVVAYLPVSFKVDGEKSVPADLIEGTSQTKMRIRRLQTLHENMVISLRPLFEAALRGIVCGMMCLSLFYPQLLLASYTADNLECKDLLKLNRGSLTASPCHLCKIRSLELCGTEPMPLRALPAAKRIFELLFDLHRKIDGELATHKYSMLPMLPLLRSLPIV